MRTLRNLSAMALSSLAGIAFAHSTSYKLAAVYTQGEQHLYRIRTSIQGMVQDNRAVALEFYLRYKVTKVLPKSNRLLITYDQPRSGPVNLPIKFKPADITLDKYNRPIDGSHSAQVFVTFPDHPISIGDKWRATSNLELPNGGAQLDVTYKLDGVKQDQTKLIGVLSTTMKGLAPGDGTVLIDMKNGSVLSSVMNVSLKDKQQKSYPVQIILRREK